VKTEERPIVEMDEMWSFVGSKQCKIWIWLAINRDTRQIAGAAFGDRSDKTCLKLWQSLPADYSKHAVIYTDFWESYADIIPSKRLRQVGKESGQTAHIERFNNTLRQRCPGMVRKTLSFSKNEAMHEKRIRIFIDYYNKSLSVKKNHYPKLYVGTVKHHGFLLPICQHAQGFSLLSELLSSDNSLSCNDRFRSR